MKQADLFEPDFPGEVPEEICLLFETLAMDIKKQGYDRYSADAVLHRIRWHFKIERGQRDFKCNDHWTSRLARWFLLRHKDMAGFFELRESPNKGGRA